MNYTKASVHCVSAIQCNFLSNINENIYVPRQEKAKLRNIKVSTLAAKVSIISNNSATPESELLCVCTQHQVLKGGRISIIISFSLYLSAIPPGDA